VLLSTDNDRILPQNKGLHLLLLDSYATGIQRNTMRMQFAPLALFISQPQCHGNELGLALH
jgi:hypothetical protein